MRAEIPEEASADQRVEVRPAGVRAGDQCRASQGLPLRGGAS